MTISSITTYGSAAIASPPPANTAAARKPNDNAEAPLLPAQQIIEAAKGPGTGQFVDKKV
jgi:hypothetical protein